MDPPNEPQATEYALSRHVCQQCRVRKRKCSKTRPACDLCVKLLLKCVYDPMSPPISEKVSDSGLSPYGGSDSSLLSNWQASAEFLATFAEQDQGGSSSSGSDIHGVTMSGVLQILTDNGESFPKVFREYFRTVGVWLPGIVSMFPLEQRMNDQPSSELALLLLSMFLAIQMPSRKGQDSGRQLLNMQTKPYFAAKTLLSTLLGAGCVSLEVLEASALILLYEAGHGIIEQAFVTASICASIGVKYISLHDQKLLKSDDSDVGRVWWSIVLLDRLMNMTLPPSEMYFVTGLASDPYVNFSTSSIFDYVQDRTGLTGASYRIYIFHRATDLMGHVVEYVKSVQPGNSSNFDKFRELDEPIQTLLSEVLQNAVRSWEDSCETIALCVSALFTLHKGRYDMAQNCTCSNAEKITQMQIALAAILSVINIVVQIAEEFNGRIQHMDLPTLALPATYAVYQAARLHITFSGSRLGTQKWNADFESLKGALDIFGSRWRIGKQYLDFIDIAFDNESRARRDAMGQSDTTYNPPIPPTWPPT